MNENPPPASSSPRPDAPASRAALRAAALERARIEYPETLPISARAAELRELWRCHQVVIVMGETGSGKTTQLPKIAVELGCGRRARIGCTQPRRIAAAAMARRLAAELGVGDDLTVGCQVRFDDRTAPETAIKFMTDGILLAEAGRDRLLNGYDAIIIDEAHERSLNIDFLLGYLLRLLPKRPDLKVAIASATLDAERFSEFFRGAPVMEVEGRSYPIEDLYLPPFPDEELAESVARGVEAMDRAAPGEDLLVFLPGEREIRECADLLNGRKFRNTEVLPLYARLARGDQQRIFHPGAMRRIILATNVAETSITIPRIGGVIDSGLARVKRFSPSSGIEELQIETIPQSSAAQRRGRCGRVGKGVCLRLYSEDDLRRAAPAADPEIRRSGLAGVILKMLELRLPRIEYFPFLDPPDASRIREGWRTLRDLGAVDGSGALTAVGRRLGAIPADPPLGKMLLAAAERKVAAPAVVIAAFLSLRDPLERPAERRQAADDAHRRWKSAESDFLGILRLWNDLADSGAFASNGALRRFCRENFINFNRVREWRNLIADLARSARIEWREEAVKGFDAELLHEALLAGLPRRIARFDRERRAYLTSDGRAFFLSPGSGLAGRKPLPEWIFVGSIVETSRVFARQAAEIRPEIFERAAPALCRTVCTEAHFEESSGFVRATERVIFGNFVIHPGRRIDYAKRDPAAAREIFLREGLAAGLVRLPGTWVEEYLRRCDALEELEIRVRRPGTILDREAAFRRFLEEIPASVNSTRSLSAWIRAGGGAAVTAPAVADLMQAQFIAFDPADYPDRLELGGFSYPLEYLFDPGSEEDGATVFVPENELNTLPPWSLEWPIRGWIADLAERKLKALPREMRRQCHPAAAAARFAAAVKEGSIPAEQPFNDALADFLADGFGISAAPAALEALRLPEYLRLKLAVLNPEGKVRDVLRELPNSAHRDSRVRRTTAAAKDLERSGLRSWPSELRLPESRPLPGGREVYPALFDEGDSAGCGLFLHLGEARFRHRDGVLRLFELARAEQCRYLRRAFRIDRRMQLSWFVGDGENRIRGELLDQAILNALGADPWSLRDAGSFGEALRRGSEDLGEGVAAVEAELRRIFELYEALLPLLRRAEARAPEHAAELAEHLEMLFAPRFLRRPACWDGKLRRYLRALRLRAERLLDNPARDAKKGEALAPFVAGFRAALEAAGGDPVAAPRLYDYWELLEEAHIACYTPELPTGVRAPLALLAEELKRGGSAARK